MTLTVARNLVVATLGVVFLSLAVTCARDASGAPPDIFSHTRTLQGRGSPFDGRRPISMGQDYNHDGIYELAIGQETSSYSEVAVLNGLTGAILFANRGPDNADSGFVETISMAGDLDNDGFRDILVGDALVGTGHVYQYSPNSPGNLLLAPRLNYDITGPGPEPGFGSDTAVFGDRAAVAWSDKGRVRLINPTSGATIAQLSGRTTSGFGFSVTGIGDVNADGVQDWLASDPNAQGVQGEAYILSGTIATAGSAWTPIDQLPAGGLIASLNNQMAAAVHIGQLRTSPFANLGDPTPANGIREQLIVSGGGDGFLAHKLTEATPGVFTVQQVAVANQQVGGVGQVRYLEGLGDVDRDGLGDFAVLDRTRNLVLIINGRGVLDGYQTVDVLQTILPVSVGDDLVALSNLGDYDGNGSIDLLVAAEMSSAADIRNDIYSVAVPEPGTAALAAIAFTWWAGRKRGR